MSDALKTLLHPFAAGLLDAPSAGGRILLLGAPASLRPADLAGAEVSCVQGFRPDFLALQRTGFPVSPRPAGDGYDAALILAGRHRGQNELRIADALERVRVDGLIVIGGGKDDGIAGLARRVADIVPLEGRAPKYHGVAVWFHAPADRVEIAARLRQANPKIPVEGRFETAPGMFSHDRVDPGSRLLAEALPADLAGRTADFCAGWGFLADGLLSRCPTIQSIDLYEADFESLEAAKRNLSGSGDARTGFHWHDLLSEPVAGRYDAIVMNPPFHVSRVSEPEVGQGMIRAAAAALRRGGRLFMVANRRLPYEAELARQFASYAEIAGDGQFKVLSAVR